MFYANKYNVFQTRQPLLNITSTTHKQCSLLNGSMPHCPQLKLINQGPGDAENLPMSQGQEPDLAGRVWKARARWAGVAGSSAESQESDQFRDNPGDGLGHGGLPSLSF